MNKPRQLNSWFNWHKFYDRLVSEAPRNAMLVEVGVFCAESLTYLGDTARKAGKGLRIVGVDWGRGCTLEDGSHSGPTTDYALEILMQNKLAEIVPMIVAPSTLAAGLLTDESCWAVFIDGCHDSWAVKSDIWAWWPKVRPGGILSGHDYDWEDVKKVVNYEFPNAKRTPESEFCWEVRKNDPR